MLVDRVSRKSDPAQRSSPRAKPPRAEGRLFTSRDRASVVHAMGREKLPATPNFVARILAVSSRGLGLIADAVLLTIFAPFYVCYRAYRAVRRVRGKPD